MPSDPHTLSWCPGLGHDSRHWQTAWLWLFTTHIWPLPVHLFALHKSWPSNNSHTRNISFSFTITCKKLNQVYFFMKLIKPLLKDNYQHTLRKERSNKIINHKCYKTSRFFFSGKFDRHKPIKLWFFRKQAMPIFKKSTLMEGGEGVLKCFWIVEAK